MRNLRRISREISDPAAFYGRVSLGYARARLSGARFGRFPVLLGKVRLDIRGEAAFGERFMVLAEVWGVAILVAEQATLTVGDGTIMNGGACIEAWHDVRIGKHALLGSFSYIIDDDRHELEPGTSLYKGPTVIGDEVWLGRNVAVLPGVTIGDGSAIGANSVVSRDIPPHSFAAGAPAKVIRPLELPAGWSRRYGYDHDRTGAGLLSMLRRGRRSSPEPPAEPLGDHQVRRG